MFSKFLGLVLLALSFTLILANSPMNAVVLCGLALLILLGGHGIKYSAPIIVFGLILAFIITILRNQFGIFLPANYNAFWQTTYVIYFVFTLFNGIK